MSFVSLKSRKYQHKLKFIFQNYVGMQIEWMAEEKVEMDMNWCVVVESREHAYLADLMESLVTGFGTDANIEMEDVDTLEEELEHTILDKIIQEWEVEEDDEMEEGVMKDCTKGLDVGSGV
jgi:hypothetical protein